MQSGLMSRILVNELIILLCEIITSALYRFVSDTLNDHQRVVKQVYLRI
jgi:hypothetical protein